MSESRMAMPGERLATEEEFVPGENTYVEEGTIFASAIGIVYSESGRISVRQTGRRIQLIDRNMMVIGTVVESVKSVVFVRIDDINVEGKEYLALKDGKILTKPPRSGGPGFRGRPGRDAPNEGDDREEGGSAKPCNLGDTVIARVQFNDKDSYQLIMDRPETGVIDTRCLVCGGEVVPDEHRTSLKCADCEHEQKCKISSLYGKSEEIKKLFA